MDIYERFGSKLPLTQDVEDLKAKIQKCADELKSLDPCALVKYEWTTFLPYDPKTIYDNINNWILIASMGDPNYWGNQIAVMMRDYACLSGFLTLQEILYSG